MIICGMIESNFIKKEVYVNNVNEGVKKVVNSEIVDNVVICIINFGWFIMFFKGIKNSSFSV